MERRGWPWMSMSMGERGGGVLRAPEDLPGTAEGVGKGGRGDAGAGDGGVEGAAAGGFAAGFEDDGGVFAVEASGLIQRGDTGAETEDDGFGSLLDGGYLDGGFVQQDGDEGLEGERHSGGGGSKGERGRVGGWRSSVGGR